jgi:hypothetical protein
VRAPEQVKQNPNASFVLSTAPLTTLVVWLALQAGIVMPQAVAAAVGTIISGSLLIFRRGIQASGSAIWDLGFVGCCRRIWRGRPDSPA